jgi:phosphatidate cytidylyltransferase
MSRLLTALVALPLIIASVWIPVLAPLFVALAIAALLAGLYEFYVLARRREIKADITLGTIFAVALLTVFCLTDAIVLLPAVVAGFVIATLTAAMWRGAPFDKMIANTGATVLGVLYVVLLGGHLIAVRLAFSPPVAARLLTLLMLVVMGADTAAYYTGRALGRHKMAPNVSPGKTWEGAAGGMIASLAAVFLARYWFFPELKLAAALPLAAVMNVLGVIGDLTESALKRGAGAKDAAHILPGHGGLLDRLDSLLFNAPVIYYFGLIYFK